MAKKKTTASEMLWAREQTDLCLFEIFVNIKAKNSGVTPKYFIEMTTAGDYSDWVQKFKEMLEAGKLK